ncbi:branched-chain amino acid ABC transporter permease [Phyllobacterium sp. SB3]|uniref:branched-chain amino acid ABC transporter permease n=1 Tax=Phyllobacterium sp. SB3 TaxID=3156073 RepID=UPI0032AF58C4
MTPNTVVKPIGFAIATILALALPWISPNLYYLHIFTMIAVYWILISTLNLLVGFTGQLSIGHVGLLAIGAYTYCLIAPFGGEWPYLALLAGGFIGGLIGLGLGLPSLRLPGFYFAMVTLAFGLIVSELALAEQWLTNGSVGLEAPSLPAPFNTQTTFHLFVVTIAAVITLMTWNLSRFMWGRAMISVRDSDVAAMSVGVSIFRTKLTVFVFSGVTAGIAGGLYAASQSYITPDAFIPDLGMFFFTAIIVGGRGVIVGPLIGTAILAALPEISGPFQRYGVLFNGVALLFVVLVAPGGVSELISTIHNRISGKGRRPAAPADLDVLKTIITGATVHVG